LSSAWPSSNTSTVLSGAIIPSTRADGLALDYGPEHGAHRAEPPTPPPDRDLRLSLAPRATRCREPAPPPAIATSALQAVATPPLVLSRLAMVGTPERDLDRQVGYPAPSAPHGLALGVAAKIQTTARTEPPSPPSAESSAGPFRRVPSPNIGHPASTAAAAKRGRRSCTITCLRSGPAPWRSN
jgi:hypothetical protein